MHSCPCPSPFSSVPPDAALLALPPHTLKTLVLVQTPVPSSSAILPRVTSHLDNSSITLATKCLDHLIPRPPPLSHSLPCSNPCTAQPGAVQKSLLDDRLIAAFCKFLGFSQQSSGVLQGTGQLLQTPGSTQDVSTEAELE